MKITPAHNRSDYSIAEKHNLEVIDVIDENGKMTEAAGEFQVRYLLFILFEIRITILWVNLFFKTF